MTDTCTAGTGELGSSCGPTTGPSVVGESGVEGGDPGDAGTQKAVRPQSTLGVAMKVEM
jgi:hypothetical protein